MDSAYHIAGKNINWPYRFVVAQHDPRIDAVRDIAPDGRIIAEFKIEYPLDVQALPAGGYLISANQAIVELDCNLREIWRWSIERLALFSCQAIDEKRIILGDASRARIVEIDRSGRELRGFDFPLVKNPHDYLEAFRLIRALDEERLLVACHNTRKLVEFDWSGRILWQVELEGAPYMPIRQPDGQTLVSLGPSGRIVKVDRKGNVTWRYDMKDSGLPTGWIAGISQLPNGHITYSDSRYDRLVEIDAKGQLVSLFQDRRAMLHPSTHVILSKQI